MQILIVYAGKTGTTEKCAKMLGEKLNNATIVNLVEQNAGISKYDLIIIGSSIRMGRFHSQAKKFINNNKDMLKTKKTAYYVCCGFSSNYKQYFENNVSKELLDNAIVYDTFGGELDVSKQKGIEKFIVHMVSKSEEGKKEIRILNENIDRFVENIKEVGGKYNEKM